MVSLCPIVNDKLHKFQRTSCLSEFIFKCPCFLKQENVPYYLPIYFKLPPFTSFVLLLACNIHTFFHFLTENLPEFLSMLFYSCCDRNVAKVVFTIYVIAGTKDLRRMQNGKDAMIWICHGFLCIGNYVTLSLHCDIAWLGKFYNRGKNRRIEHAVLNSDYICTIMTYA